MEENEIPAERDQIPDVPKFLDIIIYNYKFREERGFQLPEDEPEMFKAVVEIAEWVQDHSTKKNGGLPFFQRKVLREARERLITGVIISMEGRGISK